MWLHDMVIHHDEHMGIIESMPIPVCCSARAPWCVRLRSVARSGCRAPANEPDGEMASIVLEGTQGHALGGYACRVPDIQVRLRTDGIALQAPSRIAYAPQAATYSHAVLGQVCSRVDTVPGQTILMHTWCVWFNQHLEAPCFQLDHLVASQLAHRVNA